MGLIMRAKMMSGIRWLRLELMWVVNDARVLCWMRCLDPYID